MDFYRAELKNSPRAIDYLKGRGLTGEIAARFGIGYAPGRLAGPEGSVPGYEDKALVECGLVIEGDEGKRYDRFRDRVMFPILDARGAVIGFGGRVLGRGRAEVPELAGDAAVREGPRALRPGRRRATRSATAGRVLVVEGYMDVVALAQLGVGYAVATLGTATTPVHVQKLLRLADEIVFCFDGDAAGRKAAWRALEVSLPLAPDDKPIRFLFLPDGEDPDTFVRKHGKEAFERLRARGRDAVAVPARASCAPSATWPRAEGRAQFRRCAKAHVQKITAPALRLQLSTSSRSSRGVDAGRRRAAARAAADGRATVARLRQRDVRACRRPPSGTAVTASRPTAWLAASSTCRVARAGGSSSACASATSKRCREAARPVDRDA